MFAIVDNYTTKFNSLKEYETYLQGYNQFKEQFIDNMQKHGLDFLTRGVTTKDKNVCDAVLNSAFYRFNSHMIKYSICEQFVFVDKTTKNNMYSFMIDYPLLYDGGYEYVVGTLKRRGKKHFRYDVTFNHDDFYKISISQEQYNKGFFIHRDVTFKITKDWKNVCKI